MNSLHAKKIHFTRRRSIVAASLSCCAVLLAGCNERALPRVQLPVAGKLRLDGVTIVDTHDGRLTPGMSIVMDAGRIVTIAPSGELPNDPVTQAINAAGKFVVPGYNNMHVHVLDAKNSSALLVLMLTEGVTGFRQMSGSPELLHERRDGTLPIGKDAPALLLMPGAVLTPFNAKSAEQVAEEIKRQKADGADFIKVGVLTPDIFFAALADAKAVGLPALGHLQEGVDPAQASRDGFRSIEHLGPGDAMWVGCSSDETALLTEDVQHPRLKAPPFPVPGFVQKLLASKLQKMLVNPAAYEDPDDVARLQRALDTYDEAKCRALAATFIANGTWQTPTLVRLRTQELADAPEYSNDPALPYMRPEDVKIWREVTSKFHNLPPAGHATFLEAYQHQLALTKMLDAAGVPMIAGTDGGGQVPGQSLHQEFDELAKAGLSPLTILQMTTLNAATFLGRTGTMGSVEAGKNADLVILGANPIETVQNLHHVDGVVRAGFYYSAQDLAALKTRVAAGHGTLQ